MRVLGLEWDFSASSARGAMLGGVLASQARMGQSGLPPQGSEPHGRDLGLGSGYLEAIE